MRAKRWMALVAAAGAALAIAVSAWPAAPKQRKPLVIHTAPPLRLQVVRSLSRYVTDSVRFQRLHW